jgi:predicted DNA binding CopG/RHH family protein
MSAIEVIKNWETVPAFSTEREEAQFWLRHCVEPSLMEGAVTGMDQSESTTISLRIDPRMLARLKRLARSRYLNYQSMIKQWISEKLEAELRGRES